MKIAVVVPFVDEADVLPETLTALRRALDAFEETEVIAVDGGSRDASRSILAQFPWVRVIDAPRGRASQINAGAQATASDAILFLHADCLLPRNAFDAIRSALGRGDRWGRFDVTIRGRSRLLPFVSALMNERSRLTGIATGDQAIFVTRDAFRQVGGFPGIPLMEDIAFSEGLRRGFGRPACLRERVVTSGRRWDTHGVWRTIVSMWRLRFDYWRGVDVNEIAQRYRPLRRTPLLQIFAKEPIPGCVKTRLAASMGAEAAANVYRELVERTLATAVAARTTGIVSHVELWCDPDSGRAAFVEWQKRYCIALKSQHGVDLGARMHHALAKALERQHPALLIGTDCPSIDAAYLRQASAALATHDVVIGPAEDGGYVLIGLSRDADIFTGVPWSTADVIAVTREKILAAGATCRQLAVLWDVDTPADLARFRSSRRRLKPRLAFPWRPRPAGFRPRERRS